MTDCEHFNSPNVSIAMHFNPRFNDKNCVVINTSNYSKEWGTEVRDNYFPFAPGQPFSMMILVEEQQFKIAVNGKHCYTFPHRFDYRLIRRLHITGSITVDLVEFRKELFYLKNPTRDLLKGGGDSQTYDELRAMIDEPEDATTVIVPSPTLPYVDNDIRFGQDFNLYIAGMMPTYFREFFVINFLKSVKPNEMRNIPFHMSVRPQRSQIIRNSMVNNAWQTEERNFQGTFPFVLGTYYDLMICSRSDIISIIVNGQFLCDFTHKTDRKCIDSIEILGSSIITSLRIEYL